MKHLSAYRTEQSGLLLEVSGIVALVIVALIIRLHGISVPGIWYDEAFSVLLAQESPLQIWSITAKDVHPPLYYVLLHYWMMLFGNGVLSVRSLSVLADIGTLVLSLKLMSLIASRRAVWIAALLLALLPISIRYSQEARMYTLLGFWLMGATLTLVCWANSLAQKRFWIIYVLLMTAAFYTHYFSALCVLVHWLYWWLMRGPQGKPISVVAWMTANTTIVVLFLPWLPHFIHQLEGHAGFGWILPVTWQSILTIVWQLMFMNDAMGDWFGWRILPSVLMVFCIGSVLVEERRGFPMSVLLMSYFLVPTITLVSVSLFFSAFVSRYLSFAAIGLPLIAAVALDGWWGRRFTLAITVMSIFIIGEVRGVSAVYQQTDEFVGTSLRRDKRLDIIAVRLAQDCQSSDAIFFDSLFWYLPFQYFNNTGIQPRLYVHPFADSLWGYPDHGGWALIPQHLKWIFFDDVTALSLNTRRIWWIRDKGLPEDRVVFPQHWKLLQVLDGGGIEARLFIVDEVPASLEAGVKERFTQPPPHSPQNYPPAPSATSASKTRHSLPR